MKEGIVKLPVSMFELPEGDEGAAPEAGDSVELEGVVEKVENGVAFVRVNEAMSEESNEAESEEAPEVSEEDRIMELAKKSDEEEYA